MTNHTNKYIQIFVLLLGIKDVVLDTLVLANALYRHGARSPIRIFHTNPNQIDKWPDGPGRLTQIGMNMEYELGKFFKKRYVDTKFINQSYLHKEVYIRSSSVDRCLQSAESQLAGLYPPKGKQIWKKGLLWQPIPVQTVSQHEDSLLRPSGANCPRIGELLKAKRSSTEFSTVERENKELFDYMTNSSGQAISLANIWAVTDDLLCEQAQHMKSADWAMERFPEILNLSKWVQNYFYQGTDELGRLLGGELLGTMVSNMGKMRDNNSADIPKLNIYSGHDTSLLAFTTALNVKFPVPTFAACILIELYQTSYNTHYVTINYRNGIENSTKVTRMNLNGCDYECPWEDFIRLTSARIPKDRQKECHPAPAPVPAPGFFTKKNLQVLSAVLFALCMFFFMVVVWMLCRRKFKSTKINLSHHLRRLHTKNAERLLNDDEDEAADLIS